MLESFDVDAMLLGAIGAALHEVSRWVGLRQASRLPAYFYRLHYWVLSAALMLMGGALAALLDATTVMQALAIGISAPAIVSRLGSAAPKELHLGSASKNESMEGGDDDLHAWLRG